MTTVFRLLVSAAVVVPVAVIGRADTVRTWTDPTGKYRTEAAFLSIHANKVRLRKKDGAVVAVPLDRLSPADQDYARTRNAELESEFRLPLEASLSGPGKRVEWEAIFSGITSNGSENVLHFEIPDIVPIDKPQKAKCKASFSCTDAPAWRKVRQGDKVRFSAEWDGRMTRTTNEVQSDGSKEPAPLDVAVALEHCRLVPSTSGAATTVPVSQSTEDTTFAFDGEWYVLRSKARKAQVQTDEYILAAEDMKSWTKMISVRQFPHLSDHKQAASNLSTAVKASNPHAQYMVWQSKDKSRTGIDFITWQGTEFVEFNVFIYESSPDKKGLVAQQFAMRAYGDDRIPFMKKLPRLRKEFLQKVTSYSFPALVK